MNRSAILDALEHACTDAAAAAEADATLEELQKARATDQDFSRACMIASLKAEAALTRRIFDRDTMAQSEFLLERRFRDAWGSKASDAGNGPPPPDEVATLAELERMVKEAEIRAEPAPTPGLNAPGDRTKVAPLADEPMPIAMQQSLQSIGHLVSWVDGSFMCSRCHEMIPPEFVMAAPRCNG